MPSLQCASTRVSTHHSERSAFPDLFPIVFNMESIKINLVSNEFIFGRKEFFGRTYRPPCMYKCYVETFDKKFTLHRQTMDPTWSEARKKAYQNKETSPNQYYYRFNENPHEAKAGKWSKAEDELLIAQVREHGPKQWGILSKSIPGRVGYTCNKRYHELVAANKIPADIPTVPVRPPHEEKRTPNKITETPNVASRIKCIENAKCVPRTPNVATPNVASKKRKHEHALSKTCMMPCKGIDKHRGIIEVEEMICTMDRSPGALPHGIPHLRRENFRHANGGTSSTETISDPPYFDRELKTTFREATIQLIEKKRLTTQRKPRMMDGQE